MLQDIRTWSWIVEMIVSVILVPIGYKGVGAIKESKVESRVVHLGIEYLLHDRIFQEGTEYLHQGYVTTDELTNFIKLTDQYFALGGNGAGHIMYEKVCKLKVVDPDYTMEKYNRK